jgi:hypothetical protein
MMSENDQEIIATMKYIKERLYRLKYKSDCAQDASNTLADNAGHLRLEFESLGGIQRETLLDCVNAWKEVALVIDSSINEIITMSELYQNLYGLMRKRIEETIEIIEKAEQEVA